MNYLKAIAMVLATGFTALVASLSDSSVTATEWVTIGIAAATAAGVFAAPNIPGARYTKSILAALGAALVVLNTAVEDRAMSTSEWLQIAIVVLGALGVYAVPNISRGDPEEADEPLPRDLTDNPIGRTPTRQKSEGEK